MIEFKNLSLSYGENEILKAISHRIEKGKITGIIGLSGAGKSSLLRCINLLVKPTTGDVLIDGISVTSLNNGQLKSLRKKTGMIFQHFNLLKSKKVKENIALGLGRYTKEVDGKVDKILELVGLKDKKECYISSLSGGQKQRVAIARAIIGEPEILLCDEATSSLDPKSTDSIVKLIKKINEELKITVVFVSHEMATVSSLCDEVLLINEGSLKPVNNLRENNILEFPYYQREATI